jgi:hypothetical protein
MYLYTATSNLGQQEYNIYMPASQKSLSKGELDLKRVIIFSSSF